MCKQINQFIMRKKGCVHSCCLYIYQWNTYNNSVVVCIRMDSLMKYFEYNFLLMTSSELSKINRLEAKVFNLAFFTKLFLNKCRLIVVTVWNK